MNDLFCVHEKKLGGIRNIDPLEQRRQSTFELEENEATTWKKKMNVRRWEFEIPRDDDACKLPPFIPSTPHIRLCDEMER